MIYAVLRPMPSPTERPMWKLMRLAQTRWEAIKYLEDEDELWLVHGAVWVQVKAEDTFLPTIKGQMTLF